MAPERPARRVINRVSETRDFRIDVDLLIEDVARGELPPEAADALGLAVIALKDYSWDGTLELRPHGGYGDVFLFRFYPELAVVFRRETIRDEKKQPTEVHLFLLQIHRED